EGRHKKSSDCIHVVETSRGTGRATRAGNPWNNVRGRRWRSPGLPASPYVVQLGSSLIFRYPESERCWTSWSRGYDERNACRTYDSGSNSRSSKAGKGMDSEKCGKP